MRYPRKIRFLALFVLAFICLNAGGAVCVAYCRGFAMDGGALDQHQQGKPLAKHCDRSAEDDQPDSGNVISVRKNGDLCPMTVSFLAASVEKKSFVFVEPALAAVTETATLPVRISNGRPGRSQVHYRGPPPLDRRTERIKHCLLLI